MASPTSQSPDEWSIPEGHDPLGILVATRPILSRARHVSIDREAIARFVIETDLHAASPAWEDSLHWRGPDDQTVAWVFVLDALNFCFWAPEPDPAPRWRVSYGGRRHDGYWALVAALRQAMDDGIPLTDPDYLATIPDSEVAHILRPDDGSDTAPIPLLPQRGDNLRQLGRGWQGWTSSGAGDDQHPAMAMVTSSRGSAAELVRLLTRTFPSFDDVVTVEGERVPFHKRAQILVADLAGTFSNAGPGRFTDLSGLTAFADYKVPQVLRRLGILRYDDELAAKIAQYELIEPGSRMEIEIRAGTIWGCELARQALATAGSPRTAVEVDWLLWETGQHLPAGTDPYHRTLTIFY